jgi:serine/threonine protein phosphatase PrpC
MHTLINKISHTRINQYQPVERDLPIPELLVGAHQDPGVTRRYRPNEDTLLITQGTMPGPSPVLPPKAFTLLVVADGMGGLAGGREASQLASQSLARYISNALSMQARSPESLLSLLKTGVRDANWEVYAYSQQRRIVMGTTMTAALVIENTAYVAHVGDSRLYLYHDLDGLTPMTHDHSVVAQLVAAGIIGPDDIYTHPQRNQIYRCLGDQADVEVDTFSVSLHDDDILLLCSDGLWEMVRDRQIAAILTSPMFSPTETAHALIQAALAGGGKDNVSVIVAQVSHRSEREQNKLHAQASILH